MFMNEITDFQILLSCAKSQQTDHLRILQSCNVLILQSCKTYTIWKHMCPVRGVSKTEHRRFRAHQLCICFMHLLDVSQICLHLANVCKISSLPQDPVMSACCPTKTMKGYGFWEHFYPCHFLSKLIFWALFGENNSLLCFGKWGKHKFCDTQMCTPQFWGVFREVFEVCS